MDLIVTGGRYYANADKVEQVLRLFDFNLLIHGGATGADNLAENYAVLNGIEFRRMPANWDAHGRAAGPMRNTRMLEKFPNAIVVAFPGGKGTANCIKQARERNMLVLKVLPNADQRETGGGEE